LVPGCGKWAAVAAEPFYWLSLALTASIGSRLRQVGNSSSGAILLAVVGINGFYWFQAAAVGEQQQRSHSIGCCWI
jgi:hypothetical protein